MRIESKAFWLPKKSKPPREYEDSAACSDGTWRYAIADGASTAYQSGEWAVALTRAYVDEFPALAEPKPRPEERVPAVHEWLVRQAGSWTQRQSPPQTWYERDAAERGSAAAFLGLHFTPKDGVATWESVALGDCCLFHVSKGQLLTAFPLARAEAFTDRPALVPTAPDPLARALDSLRITHGTAYAGDMFVLASDAVSEWLLRLAARYPDAWNRIGNLTSRHFEQLIAKLRQAGHISNDDVTLVTVNLEKR
jgi:protein phosphatase 2C-like protein